MTNAQKLAIGRLLLDAEHKLRQAERIMREEAGELTGSFEVEIINPLAEKFNEIARIEVTE